MDDYDPNWLANPAVRRVYDGLDRLLLVRLSADSQRPFNRARLWLQMRPATPVVESLSSGSGRDWLSVALRSLSDTERALQGVHYRRRRLAELESGMAALAMDAELREFLTNSPMILGNGPNSVALDMEYQDFIVAARRTLDYLACIVAAYFKHESKGLGHLRKHLRKRNPLAVSGAVADVLDQHATGLQRFLSEGERKTIRDRIVHWEFVDAGTICICVDGVYLQGGGEKFDMARAERLGSVLDANLQDLERVIRGLLNALIESDCRASGIEPPA